MTGRRRKPGGMGPFIEGYRAWLAGRGYIPGTIVNMLAVAGGLGRWMDARGLAAGDLDRAAITEFRDARRAAGMQCVPALTAWAWCRRMIPDTKVRVLGTSGSAAR
jgi:hypothetical protein